MIERDFIVVIPARIGSGRLARKPLADICGKPMIVHTYERALEATSPDNIFIATDTKEIMRVKVAIAIGYARALWIWPFIFAKLSNNFAWRSKVLGNNPEVSPALTSALYISLKTSGYLSNISDIVDPLLIPKAISLNE